MELPCVRVKRSETQKILENLKANGDLIRGFKLKREGEFVFIPSKNGDLRNEFEEHRAKNLPHVGSFDRIADFYVIRLRENWEKVFQMIRDSKSPRAIFLDKGVRGSERIRELTLIYGHGEPKGYHRENGIRLYVDLSKAYFSPRLATIRAITLQNVMKFKHDRVVDMYSGIGPISVLLLKNGIKTYSFDINPEAAKLAHFNFRLNNVYGNAVIADSNQIFTCLAKADQIIMNNPTQDFQLSTKILEAFKGKIVHLFVLSNNDSGFESLRDFADIIMVKNVHGYSPYSSLYYILLRIRN